MGLFSPTSNFGRLQWEKGNFSASCALLCTGERICFQTLSEFEVSSQGRMEGTQNTENSRGGSENRPFSCI